MNTSRPVVVCVAPNGARRMKHDHGAVPLTPAELAREAARCADAGATVIHLHVRDAAGAHTLDTSAYRTAMSAIAREVGNRLVVQVTTEAVGRYSPHEQMAVVEELVPEAASMALREIVASASDEARAAKFFAWARARGVGLQHIVYSPEEEKRLVDLVRRGIVVDERPHALFVLGRHSNPPLGSPDDLAAFVDVWPSEWPWSVCAFGRTELACLTRAIELGGNVRVGFENNVWRPDGELATDNAENVAAVCASIRTSGRIVASPSEARLIYGTQRGRM